MSTVTTPNDSPVQVQPLHNPELAAQVVVPQAPLGNATNGASQAPGLGAKAFLEKRMAKGINPAFHSPTDNMMTPCSKKISAAKKKQFAKASKPMPALFAKKDTETVAPTGDSAAPTKAQDDENPF